MPKPAEYLYRKLPGILILGSVLIAPAAATNWEGGGTLGSQSYRSDSLSLDELIGSVDLRLSQIQLGPVDYGLALSAREDLFERLTAAAMDFASDKKSIEASAFLKVSRRDPGKLSLPILSFDPDALLLIEEREQSSQSLSLGPGISWTADFHSLRLEWDHSRLSYPEPDSVISDRHDSSGEARLSIYLPGSMEAGFQIQLENERYIQRSHSNRSGLEWTLRLSRFVGECWSLRSRAALEQHEVEDPSALNSYERPGGSLWKLGLAADRFGATSDLSWRGDWGRESWDDYDGFYRPGNYWESEAHLSFKLPRQVRLELLASFSGFNPDTLSDEIWTFSRSRERRMEGRGQVSLFDETSLPVELTLLGEESRFGESGSDRFRILQIQLSLRYRWSEAKTLTARLSLDNYQSLYDEEEAQRDMGASGLLRLDWSLLPTWNLKLEAERNRRFSFLETGGLIEDWQFTLGLRKVLDFGFLW